VSEILDEIDALKIKSVALGFDQDKRDNRRVLKAEIRLLWELYIARPDLKFYILDWDLEQGKGLDDAIRAGATFEWKPVQPKPEKRYVNDLPGEKLKELLGNQVAPIYSLAEARDLTARLVRSLLYSDYPRQLAITNPTGTGKSRSADDEAARAVLSGRYTKTVEEKSGDGRVQRKTAPKRILILAPDKANVAERTAPGSELHRALKAGEVLAYRQLGRKFVNEPPAPGQETDYDCLNIQAHEAGRQRHAAAKVVCKSCPFCSAANWKRAYCDPDDPGFDDPNFDPRIWKCEEEGYLKSRAISRNAQLVIATKEAYLNNSEIELGQFDVVINDEDLKDQFLETIMINGGTFRAWREKIKFLRTINNPLIQEEDWLQLFDLIEQALAAMPGEYSNAKTYASTQYLALPLIERAANRQGIMLDFLLKSLSSRPDGKMHGDADCYDFEAPYIPRYLDGKYNSDRVKKMPFKAGQELLDAMLGHDSTIRASTNPDGTFSLVIRRVRSHLIEMLHDQTLIVLDATPPPELDMLLPRLEKVCYNVAQYVEVTQITNAMYTARDLENDTTRQTVEEVAAKFFTGASKPLAIIPKRFKEGEREIKLPAGALVEHWGKHKATNQYSDCDALLMVGHYQPPLDHKRADIEAIRAYRRWAAPAPIHDEKLRLYNHLLPTGHAAGRWCSADPDPDVQAAIEHDYWANIEQAKGRLRGALRSKNNPARILVLCNEPAGALPVHRLTTTAQLLMGEESATTSPAGGDTGQENTTQEHTPPFCDFHIIIHVKTMKRGGYIPNQSRTRLVSLALAVEIHHLVARRVHVAGSLWLISSKSYLKRVVR
jgi:hypothetical protein